MIKASITIGFDSIQVLLLMVFLSFGAAIRSEAKEVFVAQNGGSDAASNPGTDVNTPLRTINRGIALANNPGDFITVRAGTYVESVKFRSGGTPTARITLRGYTAPDGTKEMPKIVGPDAPNPPDHGILFQSSAGEATPIGYITVEGMEVANSKIDGIKIYSAESLIIRNNYIHNSADNGMFGFGSNILVDGNVIADNGIAETPDKYNQDHGMYVTGSNFTIINNIFYKNLGYGIQIAGYPCSNHGVVFRPQFCGATNFVVMNNTFAFQRNRGALIFYLPLAVGGLVQNNIFYDNAYTSTDYGGQATNGPDAYDSGGSHVISNNLYVTSKGAATIGASLSEASQIILDPPNPSSSSKPLGDPLFVTSIPNDPSSPALKDINPKSDPLARIRIAKLTELKSVTRAKDAAEADSRVTKDFAGVPRPQGIKPDIGAYEVPSVVVPPNTAPKSPTNLKVG